MAAKIGGQLQRQVDEAEAADPRREIPVIVRLRPGADVASLERRGLKVHNVFRNISAVSGAAIASSVKEIAALDVVDEIEFDGEVRALN